MAVEPTNNLDVEERPPIFSSWNKWYILVLLNHVILIILFTLFMKFFD